MTRRVVEQAVAPAGGTKRRSYSRAAPDPATQSSLRRLRKLACMHTKVPREELADGLGHVGLRRKRGPDAVRRRDGAPRGAAPSGLKVRTC